MDDLQYNGRALDVYSRSVYFGLGCGFFYGPIEGLQRMTLPNKRDASFEVSQSLDTSTTGFSGFSDALMSAMLSRSHAWSEWLIYEWSTVRASDSKIFAEVGLWFLTKSLKDAPRECFVLSNPETDSPSKKIQEAFSKKECYLRDHEILNKILTSRSDAKIKGFQSSDILRVKDSKGFRYINKSVLGVFSGDGY